jgi:hypothetical protein
MIPSTDIMSSNYTSEFRWKFNRVAEVGGRR